MKDTGKIIAALLIGAAAGAAVGLLLAPESGDNLRGDIADYVNDLITAAKTKADNMKEYGNSAIDNAKSKFRGAVDNLTDQKDELVNSARAKASDVYDNAKNYGQDTYDNAKSRVKTTANDWNNTIQNS